MPIQMITGWESVVAEYPTGENSRPIEDDEPRPGAPWMVVDESMTMDADRPEEALYAFGPTSVTLRSRRYAMSNAALNIWITVRENKSAERISLRVNGDLVPFDREDALSWSRHDFEAWAIDWIDSHDDESDFDPYIWAREQVEARSQSFYAIRERGAANA